MEHLNGIPLGDQSGLVTARLHVIDFSKYNGTLNVKHIKLKTMKPFIGVKMIMAQPMTKGEALSEGIIRSNVNVANITNGDDEGYVVDYGKYKSWSPRAVFEQSYFPIEDPNKISKADVEAFAVKGSVNKLGEKTCIVLDSTLTGFDMIGTSACVDPANYSEEIGSEIARKDITDKLWGHLGFVLQWAKNGLWFNNVAEVEFEEES